MVVLELLHELLSQHFDSEKGASLVEYGLLLALIAVVCIVAVTSLGSEIAGTFNSTAGSL